MNKVINLQEIREHKRFMDRIETRTELLRAMIKYDNQYTLKELEVDFKGFLRVMNDREYYKKIK